MRRLAYVALLIGGLACVSGCPDTSDPGVETGQFGVTVTFVSEFGGSVDCSSIELVVTSSAGDVFRDPGDCDGLVWETDLLPLELYNAQVNVYDALGELSAQSAVQQQTIDLDGETVELFFDIVEDAGNFALSWSLTGTVSGPLTCADVGGDTLFLETTYVSDGGAYDAVFPCTDGEGIGPAAPLGDYQIVARLHDDADPPFELGASLERNVSLDYGGHLLDLGDLNFEFDGL